MNLSQARQTLLLALLASSRLREELGNDGWSSSLEVGLGGSQEVGQTGDWLFSGFCHGNHLHCLDAESLVARYSRLGHGFTGASRDLLHCTARFLKKGVPVGEQVWYSVMQFSKDLFHCTARFIKKWLYVGEQGPFVRCTGQLYLNATVLSDLFYPGLSFNKFNTI